MTYPYPPSPYPPGQWVAPRPPVAPPSEEGPLSHAPHGPWTNRYGAIFAGVTVVIALVAIVLAVLAPALGPRASSIVSSGWAKAYDTSLRTNDDNWATSSGCTFANGGLDVSGGSGGGRCTFQPSTRKDLTSQGVVVEVQVAPAGRVSKVEDSLILFGTGSSSVFVQINQDGRYSVCSLNCTSLSPTYTQGQTVAWHTDGYTPNTFAAQYLPGDSRLTLFANGQRVAGVAAYLSAQTPIALGSGAGMETIVTHATIYTGSGGS